MNGYLVNSKEELISKIEELTNSGDIVACGGSMSLFEAGVIDHLRSGRYEFLDRYKEGLKPEDIKKNTEVVPFHQMYISQVQMQLLKRVKYIMLMVMETE